MRSFELVYELKQQTPIIHFQYAQIGAALRATEVKPKLDRYIIERCGGINKVQLEKSEWLIEGTNALNYRMVIKAPDETPEVSKTGEIIIKLHKCGDTRELPDADSETIRQHKQNKKQRDIKRGELIKKKYYQPSEINGMYFGNMPAETSAEGDWVEQEIYEDKIRSSYKETVLYKKSIKLIIVCFNKSLRQMIDNHIESFFLTTNFGTRQTKGFGGFTIVKKNGESVNMYSQDRLCKHFKSLGLKCLYVKEPGSEDPTILMQYASCIYAIMKGGVNHNRGGSRDKYVKGFIQRRYLSLIGLEETGSEKAFIKSDLFNDTALPEKKYSDYLFVRALLGLPDNYDYKKRRKKVNVYSLGAKSFDVERMRSPVTIKIIDGCVFFIFNSIDSILGKEFYLVEETRELRRLREYDKKARYIRAKGKRIFVPNAINWDVFVDGFIKYYAEDKTKNGMKKCNKPFPAAAELELKN